MKNFILVFIVVSASLIYFIFKWNNWYWKYNLSKYWEAEYSNPWYGATFFWTFWNKYDYLSNWYYNFSTLNSSSKIVSWKDLIQSNRIVTPESKQEYLKLFKTMKSSVLDKLYSKALTDSQYRKTKLSTIPNLGQNFEKMVTFRNDFTNNYIIWDWTITKIDADNLSKMNKLFSIFLINELEKKDYLFMIEQFSFHTLFMLYTLSVNWSDNYFQILKSSIEENYTLLEFIYENYTLNEFSIIRLDKVIWVNLTVIDELLKTDLNNNSQDLLTQHKTKLIKFSKYQKDKFINYYNKWFTEVAIIWFSFRWEFPELTSVEQIEKWTSIIDAKKSYTKEDAKSFAHRGVQYVDWYFESWHLNYFYLARKDFEKAIELDPNNFYYHVNRWYVAMTMQDYEQALADFNKADELYKNTDKCYANTRFYWTDYRYFTIRKWILQYRLWNVKKWIELLTSTYEQNPTTLYLLDRRAEMYLKLWNKQQAEKDYNAYKLIERYRQFDDLISRNTNYDYLNSILTELETIKPFISNSSYIYTKWTIYQALGDFKSAFENYFFIVENSTEEFYIKNSIKLIKNYWSPEDIAKLNSINTKRFTNSWCDYFN